MSNEQPLNAHDQALIDAGWEKHAAAKPITPAQTAYALLWRSKSGDSFVNKARAALLATLTREEQREAIAWILAAFGPMQTNELIAADMRVGVFPQRSYDANEAPDEEYVDVQLRAGGE